jgi:hypothetical protein
MAPRSYLSLTKDELAHAEAIHRESIVIDASTVAFIDYVGEDVMLEDMVRGGVTAGNATVCMQRTMGEAMREVTEVHEWAERKKDKTLIAARVRT